MTTELQRCVVVNDGVAPAGAFWVCGGPLVNGCEDVGWAVEDLGLLGAPDGVSIWEGVWEECADYEGEGDFHGSYRSLTDAEWARLQQGKAPWDEGS